MPDLSQITFAGATFDQFKEFWVSEGWDIVNGYAIRVLRGGHKVRVYQNGDIQVRTALQGLVRKNTFSEAKEATDGIRILFGGWLEERSEEYALQRALAWSLETFPGQTLSSAFAHLTKEMGELSDNPDDESEMADVAMLLNVCRHHLGRHASDRGVNLPLAIRNKMDINRTRQWGEPNDQGFCEHVRVPGEDS